MAKRKTACFIVPFFADLVVIARSLYPIPSRTRPSKSSAPMVLSLKAWKSRSLPGLPRTEHSSSRSEITKTPVAKAAGVFCCLRQLRRTISFAQLFPALLPVGNMQRPERKTPSSASDPAPKETPRNCMPTVDRRRLLATASGALALSALNHASFAQTDSGCRQLAEGSHHSRGGAVRRRLDDRYHRPHRHGSFGAAARPDHHRREPRRRRRLDRGCRCREDRGRRLHASCQRGCAYRGACRLPQSQLRSVEGFCRRRRCSASCRTCC